MKVQIKCKEDRRTRRYDDAKIKYVDNGTIRFLNITDKFGFSTSYKMDEISFFEAE